MKCLLIFFASLMLVNPLCVTYADEPLEKRHWWNGFTFTPGVGARHLGLDVTRKSDGYTGNISQATTAKLFAAFSISSPSYDFTENWGVTIRSYNSTVTLDSQFYKYDNSNATPSENKPEGERINVGTRVSGRYSYLVPTLHYKIVHGAGTMAFALGFGYWNTDLSGNIALTPDDRPTRGTERSHIDLSSNNELAYLAFLSYEAHGWILEMTVGGPTFDDAEYEYKVEEVSIIVGRQFTL